MIHEHPECHNTGAHNITDSTTIIIQVCALDLIGSRHSLAVGYFMNKVMKFWVPCKGEIYLSIYMIFRFSAILLHIQLLND